MVHGRGFGKSGIGEWGGLSVGGEAPSVRTGGIREEFGEGLGRGLGSADSAEGWGKGRR